MAIKFPFNIPPSGKFDVVGFGTNAVDYLIRVPKYPSFGSKMKLNSYSVDAGGEVASTLVGLQRLGLRTAYAGRFGGDQEGALGIASLQDEGVDISLAETIADARTQIAFILIDEQSGERTVLWHRDQKLAYTSDAPPLHDAAVSGRVLHMTPHDTRMCIELARLARAEGIVVTIDIDRLFDGVDQLLPLVDVCIASEEFPARAFGIDDPVSGLREIASRFGCSVAGITLGVNGSVFLCNDVVIKTAAFAVPGGCVDTTGAGDAFRTGFLFGMISGETVEETIRMANAAAALKCRREGARQALPTTPELLDLLKKS